MSKMEFARQQVISKLCEVEALLSQGASGGQSSRKTEVTKLLPAEGIRRDEGGANQVPERAGEGDFPAEEASGRSFFG